MTSEISNLFQRKLEHALVRVDSQTESSIRDVWGSVGPDPKSPFISETMDKIKKCCLTGFVERDQVAREVVISTVLPFKEKLTLGVVDALIQVVEEAFPSNKYIALVEGTPGVYQRRQAPARKFDDRSYSLPLALIKASSANSALRSIEGIKLLLDEACLQQTVITIPRWKALLITCSKALAKPLAWVFTIVAAVITAVLLKILGLP